MSRWLGLAPDAVAGGMSYDDLVAATNVFPTPDLFIPATTAQVEPGVNPADRNDEVRGRRGNSQSFAFSANPRATFGGRAYPEMLRRLVRKALGGTIATSGTAPASISSTISPLQSGNLPAEVVWLLREEQMDRVTGSVISELSLDFPVDGEGSFTVQMDGLYHQVDDSTAIGALPTATFPGLDDVYSLRDAKAYIGPSAGTLIDCLAGFGLTFNNGLQQDAKSRFCSGKNIKSTTLDTIRHNIWYPERHKLGPQKVTGRLDFGVNRPDRELRHILMHGEKLVFEVAAGPLGTTPAADDMLRFTLYNHVPVGGGAEALTREGDQTASYEFEAFIDITLNKDIEATFVGTTALV